MSQALFRSRIVALGFPALSLLLLVALMAGCASTRDDFGVTPGFGHPGAGLGTFRDGPHAAADASEYQPAARAPVIVRGSDRMMGSPRERPPYTVTGEAVSLQFERAPIEDVVHAVFGDILELPYVISERLSGEVTIHTMRAIERDQVLALVESLLAANGLAVVADRAGVFHVGSPAALRDVAPSLDLVTAEVPGRRLVAVPLRFIGAPEMADLLRPVARPEAFVRVDGFRNLLLLAGSASQIEGWLEIVRVFDVDVLRGLSVGLFPLQHMGAADAEMALNLLVAEGGTGDAVQGRAGPEDGSGVIARSLGGPLRSVVRFLGIESLNAVLVVTSRSHYLDQAREWIERFDQPHFNVEEPRLFVYPVQNGNAAHLAAVLGALLGAAVPSAVSPDLGVAPGLEAVRMTSMASGQQALAGGETFDSAIRAGGDAPKPAVASHMRLDGDVRVVADQFNNAILVYGTGPQFQKIEAALRQLDRMPTQVLIEASIIEVSLTDDLQYGLQWFFKGGIGDYSTEGLLNLRSSGPIGPQQPGFSYTVRGSLGDVRLVLNMLADKTQLKVLSSPSVLVLDNHSARIMVGDQQPVRSATTVTDAGVERTSIEFKDTGVQLNVTPSVNAGGMVTLDIMQNVTDVGPIDAATEQRSFLQRHVSSTIAARSGETIVLGGLIRDNVATGRQGVPGLHTLPVVGALFGSTAERRARTELIVMLTPQVLETEEDLRAVGDELRRKMGRIDALTREMPRGDAVPADDPVSRHQGGALQ